MFLTAVAWVLTPHVMTSLIDKGYSALTVKMGAGFVNGAIGGGMKGGVIGAFSAGLFHGIGSTFTKEITPWAFTGGELNIAGQMAKIAAHGTAAGVTEMLRGGKFGHGFVSAAGPELLHPEIGKLPGAQLQTLGAALVGGALSHATGGKFANGATTAAFMWMFNHAQGKLSKEARVLEAICGDAYDKIEQAIGGIDYTTEEYKILEDFVADVSAANGSCVLDYKNLKQFMDIDAALVARQTIALGNLSPREFACYAYVRGDGLLRPFAHLSVQAGGRQVYLGEVNYYFQGFAHRAHGYSIGQMNTNIVHFNFVQGMMNWSMGQELNQMQRGASAFAVHGWRYYGERR